MSETSRFVWYELHTPDAEPAKAFYGTVLGWGSQDGGAPDRSYTLVTVGSTPIGGLLQKPPKAFSGGQKPGWIGYIGVSDADKFADRVKEAGGIVHRPVEDISGVGRFAVVADPQGAIFTLFEAPKGIEQPPRPKQGIQGTPAWHELAAADWAADFQFYADLFGWTKSQAIEMGPNGVYQIFATGSEPVGGIMTRMDASQAPGWLFYFNVEEINSAVTRVKEAGGKVIHGPAEVPGGQQIAICADTQGATFGIVGPRQG